MKTYNLWMQMLKTKPTYGDSVFMNSYLSLK